MHTFFNFNFFIPGLRPRKVSFFNFKVLVANRTLTQNLKYVTNAEGLVSHKKVGNKNLVPLSIKTRLKKMSLKKMNFLRTQHKEI